MTKSMIDQMRDEAYAAGLKSGQEWGRQQSMCSYDQGHEEARLEAESKSRPWRSFFAGAATAACAFAALWYFWA